MQLGNSEWGACILNLTETDESSCAARLVEDFYALGNDSKAVV